MTTKRKLGSLEQEDLAYRHMIRKQEKAQDEHTWLKKIQHRDEIANRKEQRAIEKVQVEQANLARQNSDREYNEQQAEKRAVELEEFEVETQPVVDAYLAEQEAETDLYNDIVSDQTVTEISLVQTIDQMRAGTTGELWEQLTRLMYGVQVICSRHKHEAKTQYLRVTTDGWTVELRGMVKRKFKESYPEITADPTSNSDELDWEHYYWYYRIIKERKNHYLGTFKDVRSMLSKYGNLKAYRDCQKLISVGKSITNTLESQL
jgi:hypothetical protein